MSINYVLHLHIQLVQNISTLRNALCFIYIVLPHTHFLTASVAYTAEVHAEVSEGQNKSKKVEFFIQAVKDLNEEIETLEKVRTPFR